MEELVSMMAYGRREATEARQETEQLRSTLMEARHETEELSEEQPVVASTDTRVDELGGYQQTTCILQQLLKHRVLSDI